jgi:SH3 domain protein
MLHSDEPVEILNEEGNWLSVQLKDGTQGWVLKRFISHDLPKSIQLQKMKERYDQLASVSGGAAGKIEALNKENDSLKASLESNRSEYGQLQQKYTALKSDAAHVLTIKNEYAATENKLKRTTEKLKQISLENEKLRMSSNLGWFLSGAGVVMISWLIGYMMGRSRRRKQGSRLY